MGRFHRHARAGAVYAVQLQPMEAIRRAGHKHAQRHQAQADVNHKRQHSQARRAHVKLNEEVGNLKRFN